MSEKEDPMSDHIIHKNTPVSDRYCSFCLLVKNGCTAKRSERAGHETKVETGHGYTVHPDEGKAL